MGSTRQVKIEKKDIQGAKKPLVVTLRTCRHFSASSEPEADLVKNVGDMFYKVNQLIP